MDKQQTPAVTAPATDAASPKQPETGGPVESLPAVPQQQQPPKEPPADALEEQGSSDPQSGKEKTQELLKFASNITFQHKSAAADVNPFLLKKNTVNSEGQVAPQAGPTPLFGKKETKEEGAKSLGANAPLSQTKPLPQEQTGQPALKEQQKLTGFFFSSEAPALPKIAEAAGAAGSAQAEAQKPKTGPAPSLFFAPNDASPSPKPAQFSLFKEVSAKPEEKKTESCSTNK